MEDEEEIPPYQNGRPPLPSPSPSSSQPVTVAAAPPQHTLTLALPIQQPKPTGASAVPPVTGSGGPGGGGGREDCWSEGATSVLIEAWGERYLELSRGNLKQKHWKEVAEIVSGRDDYTKPSKTDVQCKNRIDTLKKKYKQEKGKIASGQGPSKWPFFHRLDHLIGPNSKIASATGVPTAPNPTPAVAPSNAPTSVSSVLLPAKVPTAIPVGLRSLQKPQTQQPQQPQRLNLLQQQLQQHQLRQQQQQQQQQFRRSTESNSSKSPESSDSFPPEPVNRKRGRIGKESRRGVRLKGNNNTNNNWGNSIRELTRAILEFGEAYERAETSKLQEIVEMEKQRMGFAKELELQRMQFFMKTQLELTQLKQQQGRRGGGAGGGGGGGASGAHQNHHHQHSNNNRNNNSSD